MQELTSAAGIFAISLITPGPNNLAVMHAAGRGGPAAAARTMAAIVAGSLGLLGLVNAGIGALLASRPPLASAFNSSIRRGGR